MVDYSDNVKIGFFGKNEVICREKLLKKHLKNVEIRKNKMTPDRQQLKEALECRMLLSFEKAKEYLDKYEEWPDVIIRQAAQAWYDFPDKLEGMKQHPKLRPDHEIDNAIFEGHNTAIDEIKDILK